MFEQTDKLVEQMEIAAVLNLDAFIELRAQVIFYEEKFRWRAIVEKFALNNERPLPELPLITEVRLKKFLLWFPGVYDCFIRLHNWRIEATIITTASVSAHYFLSRELIYLLNKTVREFLPINVGLEMFFFSPEGRLIKSHRNNKNYAYGKGI